VSSTVAAAVRKAVRVADQATDPAEDEQRLVDLVDDSSDLGGAQSP